MRAKSVLRLSTLRRRGGSRTPNSVIPGAGFRSRLAVKPPRNRSDVVDRPPSCCRKMRHGGLRRLCAASDCRPRAVQLRGAAYPALKRLKDDSVSFRSMNLQKIPLLLHRVLQPFLLAGASHARPTKRLEARQICFSARRSWASDHALPTPTPQFYEQSMDSRGPALWRWPRPEPQPPVIGGEKTNLLPPANPAPARTWRVFIAPPTTLRVFNT